MTQTKAIERAQVVDCITSYFDDGLFEAELAALVAHPSESQNPTQAAALPHYLSEALIPRLIAAGFECDIYENPKGGPFLIARRVEGADLPTLLHYGHGDVVHGQSGKWQDDLTPFELTRVGDRLYGRGTADNKGQHLINIAVKTPGKPAALNDVRQAVTNDWRAAQKEQSEKASLEQYRSQYEIRVAGRK